MLNVLLVALGGGLGAASRYGVSLAIPARAGEWPWATFTINVTGSLLIGALAGWLATKGEAGEPWRLLLGVGVLGGFTTFSAYSLETMRLVERNDWLGATTYSLGSVIAGLAAVGLGLLIAKRVFG
ncbi:MAG: fluoride efflux transporter CrcB [Achromobacter sp.]|uniref:fluoride efflux transporter CrcB n=1 Tax=Achromobacter sp. TaxID=134375 RepID=UPI00258CE73F|nr:fluoride efflux transporter CrcB [Achromobacter sp.]MCW0207787.1 fluoride efflux transporter CrcB [Achromobacter sp.]